jgi:uncharacterized membrane protein YhaH (DUF805 family)
MEWYLMVWRKYAEFNGRARRKEYWMFSLINCLVAFVLGIVAGVMFTATNSASLGAVVFGLLGLYSLAVLVPSLAVAVRRLHDIGMSGWLLLIGLIPGIGGLVLLVLTLLDSKPGANQYGPNPKEYPQLAINQ